MSCLYIIIPAYNEEDNIRQLVDDWYPVIEAHNASGKSKLVIINDGSKDCTYDILLELAKDKPLLVPLTKPNGGHGSTLLYGYSYALQNGADYIFQTDSDGQTNPAEFDAFWKEREEYAAIFGMRPDRQDGESRKFVEKTLLVLLKIFFGVSIPDSNAPFRIMSKDFLNKYINKIPGEYNLPNVMLTTYAAYYKEKIKFIHITFKPRQGGINSINKKRIFKIGCRALIDFYTLRKNL